MRTAADATSRWKRAWNRNPFFIPPFSVFSVFFVVQSFALRSVLRVSSFAPLLRTCSSWFNPFFRPFRRTDARPRRPPRSPARARADEPDLELQLDRHEAGDAVHRPVRFLGVAHAVRHGAAVRAVVVARRGAGAAAAARHDSDRR